VDRVWRVSKEIVVNGCDSICAEFLTYRELRVGTTLVLELGGGLRAEMPVPTEVCDDVCDLGEEGGIVARVALD
jgi:hypothetical protein